MRFNKCLHAPVENDMQENRLACYLVWRKKPQTQCDSSCLIRNKCFPTNAQCIIQYTLDQYKSQCTYLFCQLVIKAWLNDPDEVPVLNDFILSLFCVTTFIYECCQQMGCNLLSILWTFSTFFSKKLSFNVQELMQYFSLMFCVFSSFRSSSGITWTFNMADIIHKIFGQKHSSKHSSDSSKGEGEGYSKHQAEFCKYRDCLADLSCDPGIYIYIRL